jgi:HEAT repeat protein
MVHSKANPATAMRLVLMRLWLFALAGTCFAQAPPTFTEALQEHHVEITETSLIQALHSPEKEVRGLAAAALAELKMTAALPEIVRAAQTEIDALTQVNIAAAATWLGSDQGLQILTSVCRNQTISAYVRITAARNAFDKQDHSCFPSLIELMRPDAEPEERIDALSAASQIKSKTPQEVQAVLESALVALRDKNAMVKLRACEALRWINDPSSLQPLQRAIDDERDESVRQQMKSSLDFLERNHPTKCEGCHTACEVALSATSESPAGFEEIGRHIFRDLAAFNVSFQGAASP